MALAVLRGDNAAALALADLLHETIGEVRIVPIQKVSISVERLRVALFVDRDLPVSVQEVEIMGRLVRRWINSSDEILVLEGISRLELYEFPERKKSDEPEKVRST